MIMTVNTVLRVCCALDKAETKRQMAAAAAQGLTQPAVPGVKAVQVS